MVRKDPAVVCQGQPASEQCELTGSADKRVAVAVAYSLVDKPMLDESHAVEGADAIIVPGLELNHGCERGYQRRDVLLIVAGINSRCGVTIARTARNSIISGAR